MTPDPTPAPPSTPEGPAATHPRRTVLRGAAVVGALGLSGGLAACGGGGDEETAEQSGGSTGEEPSGGSPASSSAPSTGGESGGGGAAIGKVADVPVDGGIVLRDAKIVVTQPIMSDYKAFTAVCTHNQCTVGSVEGGTINCPCHGSKFSISDGSVVNGPAAAPLEAKQIRISGADIFLA